MIAMALRPEGVRIVRAADTLGLARLPIGNCDEVVYMPDGSLLTCNDRGLCRWPVRQLQGGTLRMGPPEPLAPVEPRAGFVPIGLATSSSGRRVGAASPASSGSVLLDPEQPWRRTWLIPHQQVIDLAISPDGRWAATGGLDPSVERRQVKVWDAATGQLRVELPVGNAFVAFRSDGGWLGVGGASRYRFFRTGSWTPGAEIEHGAQDGGMRLAFHPNSRIAALLDATSSVVRLAEVETGRVLASFESPNESSMDDLVFSPDGRFLATSHRDQTVDVWDLFLIRRRLEELNLATGIPDVFDGRATDRDVATIDRLEVEWADPAGLGRLAVRRVLRKAGFALRGLLDAGLADADKLHTRGELWNRLGHWRMAAADYRASLARRPNSAVTANDLAWCLASMPGRGDAVEGVRWARKAVELVPRDADYRNTLGVALYRAGEFAEAAVELKRNIAQNSQVIGFDWVFLAMCQQRLGQAASARFALGQALRWRAAANPMTPGQTAEFHAFLREAESVLNASLPGFPPDVFDR